MKINDIEQGTCGITVNGLTFMPLESEKKRKGVKCKIT